MYMSTPTIQVDYNYTSDEQENGLAKLVEAAVAYDATGPACLGLGAFQVWLSRAMLSIRQRKLCGA